MKKKLITLSGFGLVLAPMLAFAQTTPNIVNCAQATIGIEAIICKVQSILNLIIPVIIVLGVVYFVWGVVTYVIADDEEAKKAGTNRMIYGIIGLVVIIGMWGLVRIIAVTIGVDNNTPGIELPCVPGTPGCNN